MTHYEILGVPGDATLDQIKKKYRLLAQAYHPDKYIDCPDVQERVAEKMVDINAAYAILSDPEERRAYDLSLSERNRTKATKPVVKSAVKRPVAKPVVESVIKKEIEYDWAPTFWKILVPLFAIFCLFLLCWGVVRAVLSLVH